MLRSSHLPMLFPDFTLTQVKLGGVGGAYYDLNL